MYLIFVGFPLSYPVSSTTTPTTHKLSLSEYKEKYGDFQFTRVPYTPPVVPEDPPAPAPPAPDPPAPAPPAPAAHTPPQGSGTLPQSQEPAPAFRDRLSEVINLQDSSPEITPIEPTCRVTSQQPPLSASSNFYFGEPPIISARPKATNLRVNTDFELSHSLSFVC